MPMNRNVKAKRVCEDWTVTSLQSVLLNIFANRIKYLNF